MQIKEPDFFIDRAKLSNMKQVNRIIIHHTGVDVDQSAKTIHDYHVKNNGWTAIGYHFLVRYNGTVEKGRPPNKTGAHTYGQNHDSLGVCVTGNFSNTDILKRPAQYNALVALVKNLYKTYPHIKIQKHNDHAKTQCPGNLFPWAKFLQDVAAKERNENPLLKEENQKLREAIKATIAQLQKVLE